MSTPQLRKVPTPRSWAPPTPFSLAVGGLLLLLLLGAIAHFSVSVYQLPVSFPWVLGMSLMGGILSTVIWALPRHRERVVVLVLCVVGVLVLLNQSMLLYGVRACWEAFTRFWADNTIFSGYYLLADPLPPLQHQGAAQVVWGTLLALLALPLGWAILRLRIFWPTFALTLPWLMPAFLAEVDLDWPAMVVICACWAALLLSSLAARRDATGGARVALVALPACLAVIGLVLLLYPYSNYTKPAWAVKLYDQLMALEWFPAREDDQPQQTQEQWEGGAQEEPIQPPQLYFSSAGPRYFSGRGILRVTTTSPGPMYLRGQIFQDYTSQAWTGVTPSSTQELGAFSGENLTLDDYAIITFLNSPESTAYLPYETTIVEQAASPHGTSVVFPASLQEYSAFYTPLEQEPSPRRGTFTRLDPDTNYLDVPEDISGFLLTWMTQAMDELDASGDPILANATGTYAAQLNTAATIAQLLERNTTYDLRTPRTPSDRDFVSYFLGESRQGYCVHYASAATLLLRLQGIPARYVSGYAVTISEDAVNNTGVYEARVADYNAHAWVEIFLDGYGWYPVEVTPASSTPLLSTPEVDPVASAAPTSTPAPTPTLAVAVTAPPASTTPEVSHTVNPLVWLRQLVWAVPVLVVAAALCLVREVRRRRWKRMCRRPDTNAAVLDAYRWFGQLERWGGQAGEETEALARKARFSQHTLTAQERGLVLRQMQEEVARLKQSAPLGRRWLLGLLFPVGSRRKRRETL